MRDDWIERKADRAEKRVRGEKVKERDWEKDKIGGSITRRQTADARKGDDGGTVREQSDFLLVL